MDRLTIRTLFLTLTSDDERLRCFFMAAIFSLSTTSFGVKKWLALLRHALLVQDQGCGEGGRERGRKAGDGEVVVWRWGSGGVEMGKWWCGDGPPPVSPSAPRPVAAPWPGHVSCDSGHAPI